MIKVKLKELMWDFEVTAKEISQKTGISENTLTHIKNKKHVNIELDTVDKLCRFFNCRIQDLLEFHKD